MKLPLNIPPASIGQKFGEHLIDYSQFGLIGHNGIDFPAPLGTPIYAIGDGWIVEQTAKETGFGLRITQRIELNNKFYMVVYGHMQKLEDPTNIPFNWGNKTKTVKEGDTIGYVNSTGFSTGNHLHLGLYEMTESGQTLNLNNGYKGAIDPMPFLKGTMSNTIFVHKAGTSEYGFYVPATSEEAIKDKATNYGVDILNNDAIDYSKAKDISGL